MRRRRLRRKPIDAEIPTSSTGDIAFLLIIFFMVTATFAVTKGLEFDLPESEPPRDTEGKESVLIEIRDGGEIFVDCRPMAASAILDYLEPKLSRNPEKPVVIYAHESAKYRSLIDVYEALSLAQDRGMEKPEIQIPTPDLIAEYVAVFKVDPFKVHCEE